MIFFPGLDVEKSKRRRWLIYKKSLGSHLERLFLFFLLGSQFLCTLLLYGSLDPDNPNDVFAGWFLIPLWILLILYVTCMAVFETFLKKRNTTFGKEENKALLQQLAVQRNWKSVRRSGDCLIYIMSDEEISYRSLSIMVFLVDDSRVLYTLIKKHSRLDAPSLFEIWLLHYDVRKLFRDAIRLRQQELSQAKND